MEPLSIALVGGSVLLAMGLASVAALKGWQAWLDFKRLELASQTGDHGLPPATGRIELAVLDVDLDAEFLGGGVDARGQRCIRREVGVEEHDADALGAVSAVGALPARRDYGGDQQTDHCDDHRSHTTPWVTSRHV